MAHQLPTTDETRPVNNKRSLHRSLLPTDVDRRPSRVELRRRLARLCDDVLPALATTEAYPVAHDHCFRRLAYDTAVGAEWTTEIGRPFVANADDTILATAYRVAAWMVRDGPEAADACQEKSLRLRGVDE